MIRRTKLLAALATSALAVSVFAGASPASAALPEMGFRIIRGPAGTSWELYAKATGQILDSGTSFPSREAIRTAARTMGVETDALAATLEGAWNAGAVEGTVGVETVLGTSEAVAAGAEGTATGIGCRAIFGRTIGFLGVALFTYDGIQVCAGAYNVAVAGDDTGFGTDAFRQYAKFGRTLDSYAGGYFARWEKDLQNNMDTYMAARRKEVDQVSQQAKDLSSQVQSLAAAAAAANACRQAEIDALKKRLDDLNQSMEKTKADALKLLQDAEKANADLRAQLQKLEGASEGGAIEDATKQANDAGQKLEDDATAVDEDVEEALPEDVNQMSMMKDEAEELGKPSCETETETTPADPGDPGASQPGDTPAPDPSETPAPEPTDAMAAFATN